MQLHQVESYVAGRWMPPGADGRLIQCAITGKDIALASATPPDSAAMLDFAKTKGGPALRALTFHDRAKMLKALALYLQDRKQALYDFSYSTGATAKDHLIDVDGGIGTLLVMASKGRREMPDGQVYLDGPVEQLSRGGTFMGQHICTPRHGVAVHINAFNFPVWGMLEKLAPAILAGVAVIVKPATASCYVTQACVRMILDSGILPAGSLQLVCGTLGNLLDQLDCQDVVSFTGSAATACLLRSNPNIIDNAVRFIAEQDSLNASILGPDATPGTPEFDLFVTEAFREITTKAGQKCTAIRRVIAPNGTVDALIAALSAKLDRVVMGDPRQDTTTMGALISLAQRQDVLDKAALIGAEADCVYGSPTTQDHSGGGAFMAPLLFHCADPDAAHRVHDTEAFGPVATILGYRDVDHAVALANRGGGTLVTSVITHDPDVARVLTLGTAVYNGRIYINDRVSMDESTGHGSPLPHMVHGGPGRAGGGEELGGVRGVLQYMHRTALQASPDILAGIGGRWVPGAKETYADQHPFQRRFGDLTIGETLVTGPRTITLDDIETFAHFTGDTFYAHMDDAAAQRNPFFPGRVAHGYLLLSFAAGLFVSPDEGPVLANTGLDNLRFMDPVVPGDAVSVRLTVKHKTPRNADYGEVRWHVTLFKQTGTAVAEYELLTMVAH